MSRRISRSGLCDVGLPVALLPQHHLRRHRQRHHLRPGGGAVGSSAASPEEEECVIAPQCKPPTSSPATSALTPGHSRQGTCLTSILLPISTLQLSTQPPAAYQLTLPPRSPAGVTALILTGSAGRQVNQRHSVIIRMIVLQNDVISGKVRLRLLLIRK